MTNEEAKLPQHLIERNSGHTLDQLQRWANGIRMLYGAPVYLCGSALREDCPDPRDWDIRVCLPDDLFSLRYAGGRDPERVVKKWTDDSYTGKWGKIRWHWADDCVNESYKGRRVTGLNIDFQVYPESHANSKYKDKPKARIDTYGDEHSKKIF